MSESKKSKKKTVEEPIQQKEKLGKRWWTLAGLSAISLIFTGFSVVDGNRATTWILGAVTIMLAIALINESMK